MIPRLRVGAGTLHCSTPSHVVQSPSSLRVLCHSIVGLGLCLCGRVVSLWNSGDGLCRAEGRVGVGVVCAVNSSCVVVGVSVWRVCCLVVLCCGLWNGGVCGLVVCLPLLSSPPFLLLGVGVRGSARAALRARTLSPNTIVFSLLIVFLLFQSPLFFHHPLFLLLWNGGV